MNRILIVEDEPRIVSFLEKGLQARGFTTTSAPDGGQAMDLAMTKDFDLMILDLGLPDQDGMTVLAALRKEGLAQPIIVLTARDDVRDKVAGFEAGADDYVTKPFRFEELLARIRVRLRSFHQGVGLNETILSVGAITLDLYTRQVKVGDECVDLSSREFALMETFMRHPEQALSREELLERVWRDDYGSSSNVVDVYVGYLRRKLGSDAIETVRGLGYRMGNPSSQ